MGWKTNWKSTQLVDQSLLNTNKVTQHVHKVCKTPDISTSFIVIMQHCQVKYASITNDLYTSISFSYSVSRNPLHPCIVQIKVVTRNLLREGLRRCFPPVTSDPSLPFFLLFPFPSLSPPGCGPSNPAKGFWGALLAAPAGKYDICSYQTHQKCVCGRVPAANAFLVFL